VEEISFWNVAELENKDRGFWNSLKWWEVIIMSETWVKKSDWERIKKKLPKGCLWGMQEAERENRKKKDEEKNDNSIYSPRGEGKRRERGGVSEG